MFFRRSNGKCQLMSVTKSVLFNCACLWIGKPEYAKRNLYGLMRLL